MKIKIICVGKIKEKYWTDAINEYKKRLSKYCDLEVCEVSEEKISIENPSYISIAKQKEGERILSYINEKDYVILCDLKGTQLDSIELSNLIKDYKEQSYKVAFIIGGSYGVSDDVIKRANKRISFSHLTFPHQLFRVLLFEQIYRSFKIINNERYHK